MSNGAVPPKPGENGKNLFERLADAGATVAESYAKQQATKSVIQRYAPSGQTMLLVGGGLLVGVVVLVLVLKK